MKKNLLLMILTIILIISCGRTPDEQARYDNYIIEKAKIKLMYEQKCKKISRILKLRSFSTLTDDGSCILIEKGTRNIYYINPILFKEYLIIFKKYGEFNEDFINSIIND